MRSPAPASALAALSGGVDSSVAALLAQRQGFQVTALTLALPGADVEAARATADRLGVQAHVVDAHELLERQVIVPFLDEHERGRTPNPCVLCNALVKFPLLLEWADRLGCEKLVTGHYARIEHAGGQFRLLRGADQRKDQSYMLYRLRQEMLKRALFPVGELAKKRVWELAAEAGLLSAEREESQDVCFVTAGDTAGFIRARRPEATRPGSIADKQGNLLGEHTGLAAYTVGQRKGLGLGGPEGPYYVLEICAEVNVLVVGAEEELWTEQCALEDVHLVGSPPADDFTAEVVTRYRGEATPARVRLGRDSAAVSFERPHRAPAPGQSAVFYQGERVLGGGTIRSAQ